MKNFLHGTCGFSGDFTIKDREAKCVDYIKERVGDHTKVLVSCSNIYAPIYERNYGGGVRKAPTRILPLSCWHEILTILYFRCYYLEALILPFVQL